MEIIWFLIIGAVSGWLAGQFWKGSGFGLIGNIITGILGGVIGGWLAGELGIMTGSGLLGKILIAAGGAWVLLFILSLIKR